MTERAGPAVGDLLELAPDHYKFGTDPVVCRVERIIAAVHLDGQPWWLLEGTCKNGTLQTVRTSPAGWYRRQLYVAGNALPLVRRSAPSVAGGPDRDQGGAADLR